MFKHILLPTDGSELSERAILKGIELAKVIQARVTGLYVAPEFRVFTTRSDMLEETKAEFAKESNARAEQYLRVIASMAREAGVQSDTAHEVSDHPYESIIKVARERSCDLVVMASHGRSGARGILLGSVTQKVLTHCTIPVLVLR